MKEAVMPDRPAPDKLERHLARLAAAGERVAQLPDAAEIRGRARRRQRTRVAGVAIGVTLLAALAFQARTLLDRNEPPVLGVTPVPTVTTRPAPTTTRPAPTTTHPPTIRSAPTATASPRTALPTGVSRFSVVPNVVRPGQRVTLAGSGCPAHARVTLQWNVAVNSVNVAPIGTVTATADGSFRTTWMVPDRMRPGRFQISADCGQRLLGSAILTVVETTTT
jgi:hypothetical protein